MTRKKEVRALLKKNQQYKKYKSFFMHRSTSFIFCFFDKILEDVHLSIEELAELEMSLISDNKNETMFVEQFRNYARKLKKYHNLNFTPFAKYFFYVCQLSTFFKDEKKQVKNIYTRNNYNVKNERKREHFYEWLRHLRNLDPDFNRIILKLKKRGL